MEATTSILQRSRSLFTATPPCTLLLRSADHVRHVPTVIILQFIATFLVWIIAEHLRLSAVLTTVCFAIFVAQSAPQRTPARLRIPTYAVWETTVFAINILAFIFIGLQIRPIFASLEPGDTGRYLMVAGAVLLTVIVVRFAWHMPFNAVIRWRDRAVGFHPPRPMLRATVGSGLLISWAGMRGIVSLATALALPLDFPYRGLIVLTAFCVVLGTLVIQGMTLKPLLRMLNLQDDDPVGHEVQAARGRALEAALARCGDDQSAIATMVRKEFKVQLTAGGTEAAAVEAARVQHAQLRAEALDAARQAVFTMRANDEIGDDAFHQVEEQLDWMEMAGGRRED